MNCAECKYEYGCPSGCEKLADERFRASLPAFTDGWPMWACVLFVACSAVAFWLLMGVMFAVGTR